ncbi:Possible bacteriophage antirepressor [Laribacter hongkongensis HLHK9]|uniref:Possible bacteriophage antirepressor n=1 Tax=Laribacter hongkongensis (strain HLHK9) TaxID=557598 RepID=C1D862_LARHH|nr:Bro-N domain-containing protein [Laribacter hongkongensis]ACO74652.1 Possible bacteriophage antirepressor [Laribacter hongkongensis HLHK9]
MAANARGASAPAVFSFDAHVVRTHADATGELWFCATDVCDVLGYRNARDAITKHCREKGVAKRDTLTDGGKQELVFISEPNLYRLIVKSRKPEAERFETWVMEDVLPAIRKTGSYAAPAPSPAPKSISADLKARFDLTRKRFIAQYDMNGLLSMKEIPEGWELIDMAEARRIRDAALDVCESMFNMNRVLPKTLYKQNGGV